MPRELHCSGFPRGVFCILTLLGLPGPATRSHAADAVPPAATPARNHFAVPVGQSRKVYPGSGQVPERVAAFWREAGPDWGILWDSVTRAPRLVWPTAPYLVAEPTSVSSGAPDALVRSVTEFLWARSDLLGVTPGELSPPHVYTVADDWILLFHQYAGGIRVRGASVRVVVHASGRLRYLKAFNARGLALEPPALISRDEARRSAGLEEEDIARAELQIGFNSENDLREIQELWAFVVDSATADRPLEEVLVNARTGVVLERRSMVKYLGGVEAALAQEVENHGVVAGTLPEGDLHYSTPWIARLTVKGLERLGIEDLPPLGQGKGPIAAVTDREGKFTLLSSHNWPLELLAELRTGNMSLAGDFLPFAIVQVLDFQGGIPGDDIFRMPLRLDANFNFAPDALQTHTSAEEVRYWLEDPRGSILHKIGMAWAFQCSQIATEMIQELRTFALESLGPGPRQESFLSQPRELEIAVTNHFEVARHSTFSPGGIFRLPRVQAPLGRLLAGAPQTAIQDAACPTALLHEVGHHLVCHLTGRCGDAHPEDDFEEAMANLLTALHTNASRIRYLLDATGAMVPLEGFEDLDLEFPVASAGGVWRRAATALWRFHGAAQAIDPEARWLVQHLLFLFLAHNRTTLEDIRRVDASHDLFAEILLLLESPALSADLKAHLRPQLEVALRSALLDAPMFDPPFARGDANQDGEQNISDALRILHFLFQGGGPTDECLNAMDADDNGSVELTDVIRILQFLFLGKGELPAPFPGCGHDPDDPATSGNLGCRVSHCVLAL